MVDGPSLQGPRRQNSPEPYADLVDRLQQLRQDMNDLTGAILKSAGIRVAPDGMTIESALDVLGSLDVSGPLSTTGATSIGGTLNVTGDAVFSGDLAVPNGSITNDALQNPVTFLADFADNTSLSLTTVEATLSTYAFTVPAGFTKVLVVGYASIGIINPTGSPSSIGGRVYIDRPSSTSVWGPRVFQQALAGADAACYPYKQTVIQGLSGGETVTVRLVGLNSGGANWGPTSGVAALNVQAYFGRG